MTKKFNVFGMTCANCALGIEKTVKKLNGVKEVFVSLMAKEMVVDYDDTLVDENAIISLVKSIGYTASIYGEKNKNTISHAKVLKIRFFVSLIFLVPLMYLCMGKLFNAPLPSLYINYAIQWVLATVIIALNFAFFKNGFKAVIRRMPNMDTLISLGSFVAYVYSAVMTVIFFVNPSFTTHVFFEGAAMVLSLVTLGKWLEELSKKRTGDEIEKLAKLMPENSTVIRDGVEMVILSKQIVIGDTVVLKSGDFLSVDGIVISGSASVDKSALTGESLPVEVKEGDKLNSGTVIKNGYILLQAKNVGEDSLFSRIIEMVKSAGASKAPVQKAVDKVSAIFVPVVTAISILTFIIWMIISKDVYVSINYAVSVLVISCPCSLGLATPVAVMASMGKGATLGVLFKDAEALTLTSKIDTIFLDKTATITKGTPEVVGFTTYDTPENLVKEIAYSLEEKSSHPLSEAIKDFTKGSTLKVDEYKYLIGKGILGKIGDKTYCLGNEKLISEVGVNLTDVNSNDGTTTLYLAEDNRLIAKFSVVDTIRDDSFDAIKGLSDMGIETVMLTGDNETVAKSVSEKVGINRFYHSVLPEDKANYVKEAVSKNRIVAMIGDGINDSIALKSASVGVAVGTGTDVAIDSASVVLTGGGVYHILDAINLSKKTVRIINQNLFWAFCYNFLAIPIAAGALSFIGIIFQPWIASVCMSISSLFVVSNALRIRLFKNKKSKINVKENKEMTVTFKIEGMMCLHCTGRVEQILKGIDGVLDVKMSLEDGTATVTSSADVKELGTSLITQAGYKVISVK